MFVCVSLNVFVCGVCDLMFDVVCCVVCCALCFGFVGVVVHAFVCCL